MGSSAFAVPSLAALQDAGYPIVGVFTAPDKPQGRGRRVSSTPVKQYAEAHGLPLYQPARLRDPALHMLLKKLQPDLQVVVAFRKLPEAVWAFPSMGSLNLHASLLPAYRGAAPINWALIRGEKQTGLTTFFITKDIDTGPILLQEEVAIAPDDVAGSLHDRMSQQGADLLLNSVAGLVAGSLKPRPQPTCSADCPTAPKLHRDTCQINWQLPAQQIQHFVRGLAPLPGAWTMLKELTCKVYDVQVVEDQPLAPGECRLQADGLFFGSTTHTLAVQELQLAGKRRMCVQDFLRGQQL